MKRIKNTLLNTLLIAMFLLMVLCAVSEAAELSWTGCGITKKAFMQELAEAYQKKTGVVINISGGGATKGIRETAAGRSDLGGSCRKKLDLPEEKNARMVHVAWDALVIIVNKDNPVNSLSREQVKDLFLGKINNWKALGGADAPINLYVRQGKISGVGLTFRELVFDDSNTNFSTSAIEKKSSGPVEEAILQDKNGIGATGVSSAKKHQDIKLLQVAGQYPDKKTVMSGKYPYFRPLYLVTQEDPTGEVKKFVDFALSAEGQKIISSQGTVNLAEGRVLEDIAELEGMLK